MVSRLSRKNIKFLTVFIFASLLILCAISTISKIMGDVQYHFKTGADFSKIFNRSLIQDDERFKNTYWQDEQLNTSPTFQEIASHYSQAMQLKADKNFGGNREYLEEYFDEGLIEKILIAKSPENHQTIYYGHKLKFKSISKDKKIVVFTDTQLEALRLVDKHLDEAIVFHTNTIVDIMMVKIKSNWKIVSLVTVDKHDEIVVKDQTKVDLLRGGGINYYPSDTPWEDFWDSYSEDTTKIDLTKISELDLKFVRVFIPFATYDSVERINEYSPKFKSFLDIAQQNDLQVMITFFDQVDYSPSNWIWHINSLKRLIMSLDEHPSIYSWDVKNEPDLDFELNARLFGRTYILNWLQIMMQTIRQSGSKKLVTIGWSRVENAMFLEKSVDFVSFHYFDKINEFDSKVSRLKSKTEKDLVVSEFGTHSCNSFWNPFGQSALFQANYVQRLFKKMSHQGIQQSMIWAYSDFESLPSSMLSMFRWDKNCAQRNMGIFDKDLNSKPVLDSMISENHEMKLIIGLFSNFTKFVFLIFIFLGAMMYLKVRRSYEGRNL